MHFLWKSPLPLIFLSLSFNPWIYIYFSKLIKNRFWTLKTIKPAHTNKFKPHGLFLPQFNPVRAHHSELVYVSFIAQLDELF